MSTHNDTEVLTIYVYDTIAVSELCDICLPIGLFIARTKGGNDIYVSYHYAPSEDSEEGRHRMERAFDFLFEQTLKRLAEEKNRPN